MYESDELSDYVLDSTALIDTTPSTTVFALQDGDYSEDTIDTVVAAIESSTNDLARLYSQIVALESVGADATDGFRRDSLLAGKRLRLDICRRNRINPGFFSSESVGYRENLILAIEEEVNEEKGIFKKIIDAIVNGFKWLWEKITSIFSKKAEEKDMKSLKEEIERLKGLQSKGESGVRSPADDDAFSEENIAELFGFLGKTVSAENIKANYVSFAGEQGQIKSLLDAVTATYSIMVDQAQNMTTIGDVGDKYYGSNAIGMAFQFSNLTTTIQKLPRTSAEDNSTYLGNEATAKPKYGEYVPGENRKFAGFLKGAMLVFSAIKPQGAITMLYSGKFYTPSPSAKAEKVNCCNISEAIEILQAVLKAEELNFAQMKDIANATKTKGAEAEKLGAALNNVVANAKTDEEKKLCEGHIKMINFGASLIGAMALSLSSGVSAAESTNAGMRTYVGKCISKVEVKKEKTEDKE